MPVTGMTCANCASTLTVNGQGSNRSAGSSTAIVVGADATFPPFESLDAPRRKIVGFDVDLMNAIADRADLKVEIVATRYGELLVGIAQCQITAGISAIPITEDLEGQMLFSEPYFVNGQVVVVKKGNITITGRDSLAGHDQSL